MFGEGTGKVGRIRCCKLEASSLSMSWSESWRGRGATAAVLGKPGEPRELSSAPRSHPQKRFISTTQDSGSILLRFVGSPTPDAARMRIGAPLGCPLNYLIFYIPSISMILVRHQSFSVALRWSSWMRLSVLLFRGPAFGLANRAGPGIAHAPTRNCPPTQLKWLLTRRFETS